jgi:hypothetical protein
MSAQFEQLVQTSIAEAKPGNRRKARVILGVRVRWEPGTRGRGYGVDEIVEGEL